MYSKIKFAIKQVNYGILHQFFLALGVIAYLTNSSAAEVSIDEITSAEKRAIDSRNKIESGHFVVSVRFKVFKPQPDRTNLDSKYEIFLNGESKRVDLSSCTLSGNCRTVSSIIFTKDTFARAPLVGKSPVQLFGPKTKPTKTIEIPNPKVLGFVPWNFSSNAQFGLESYLLNPDRNSLTGEYQNYQGEPVLNVSYQKSNGEGIVYTEYKLAVEKGFQPLFLSVRVKNGEQEVLSNTVENKLEYHENSKTWFPKIVTYKNISKGELQEEEIDTVELAKINPPIDAQKFSINNIGLSEGKLVDQDGIYYWWTGNKLVPKQFGQNEYQRGPLETANGSSNSIFLLVNAIVFAILAIAFIWFRLLKGAKK